MAELVGLHLTRFCSPRDSKPAAVDDRRAAVIKEYAQKYSALNHVDAKAMAEQMFDYELRLTELKKTYFKKFNKGLPALTVSRFFQLEHCIDLLMDIKVESSLPPLFLLQPAEKDRSARALPQQ
jgi:hypothetical protein